ncbi:restriction endonuclease [Alsobacter soli]|nr:restriction endonuclease [Alsobacter soli]
MAPPTTTRTLAQLHFEDLDPRRFEDLVRQLAYDFRDWARIEATGRAGSDDGFDARAVEKVLAATANPEDDGGYEEGETAPSPGRLWLIQCKREKSLPPGKVAGYLEGLREAVEAEGVYGIVFAAACDFSKHARDKFFEMARNLGLQEAYMWGKGELEDMLFQPKNDGLLFAYFGFSLSTRRRTLKTDLRAKLAAKRKAARHLEVNRDVLVRYAGADKYPEQHPDESLLPMDRKQWRLWTYEGLAWDGLRFSIGRHFAWMGPDGSWDWAREMNDARPHFGDEHWERSETERRRKDRHQMMEFWMSLPEEERGWLEVSAVIPFQNVVEIDEHGDDIAEAPHVYVLDWDASDGPFAGWYPRLTLGGTLHGRYVDFDPEKEVDKFPAYDPDWKPAPCPADPDNDEAVED